MKLFNNRNIFDKEYNQTSNNKAIIINIFIQLFVIIILYCMKSIKKTISFIDLFKQPIAFRYKSEPDYQTCTGGLISIILIIIFATFFFSTILSTIKKQEISSSNNRHYDRDPTPFSMKLGSQFMFAIGVANIDLNSGDRYFDIFMEERLYTPTKRTGLKIPLVKCQKQHWSGLGLGFQNIYERLSFQKWLCPPINYTLKIEGGYTSQNFQHYKFSVVKCNASIISNQSCASDTSIENFLNQYQAFNFNFYFSNTLLNPNTNEPQSLYLDDSNYILFSPKQGVSSNLYISDYQIKTDQSIWPFQNRFTQNDVLTGGIALNKAQVYNYEVRLTEYLKFYIRKSNTGLEMLRSFTRIDDTVSYIGGLFSAILFGMSFISVYNERSYEMSLSPYLFFQEKAKPYDYNGFNFFTFLGHIFYSILLFFKIQLAWPKMKKYDEALEQVQKQLDIRLILKKISYLEKTTKALLNKDQRYLLHYYQPPDIDHAISSREQYYSYFKLKKKIKKEQKQQKKQNIKSLKVHQSFTQLELKPYNRQINKNFGQFIKSYELLELNSNEINNNIIGMIDPQVQQYYRKYVKNIEQIQSKNEIQNDQLAKHKIQLTEGIKVINQQNQAKKQLKQEVN